MGKIEIRNPYVAEGEVFYEIRKPTNEEGKLHDSVPRLRYREKNANLRQLISQYRWRTSHEIFDVKALVDRKAPVSGGLYRVSFGVVTPAGFEEKVVALDDSDCSPHIHPDREKDWVANNIYNGVSPDVLRMRILFEHSGERELLLPIKDIRPVFSIKDYDAYERNIQEQLPGLNYKVSEDRYGLYFTADRVAFIPKTVWVEDKYLRQED